mgnify:CR=1 FL=1
MRQHVNPLSKYFYEFEPIPHLSKIFKNPELPLHIDIGCGSGKFLFDLALENSNWNYLGIEIREKLVLNAKIKLKEIETNNLNFSYGNATLLIKDWLNKDNISILDSVSFNFPDPWFKNKHHKRRVIQSDFIKNINKLMKAESLIFVKTDVQELFEHMDEIILNSDYFIAIDLDMLDHLESFNPNQINTQREEYALENKLRIFKKIYKRIY